MNTGAKWIDGKTIYKKTISCGNAPNAASKEVPANIPNLDKMIKLEGMAYNSTAVFYFSPSTIVFSANPFSVTGSSWNMSYIKSRDVIGITTGIDRSSCTVYATIWYTKNT